ncbi:MAG TPA: TetR/AcrR family transcriptional regulator [Trebonia sp.]|nr:TetR/AcrR family transcriptional regulator [Trebonia sp.]
MSAPTALELLWGTRDRPRRGPRPSLSLDRIVAEAISLADADGLANLSMQHLAERLGCAKMALYRYVPGKSELVALMIDAALGDPPEPPAQTAQNGPSRGAGDQRWRAVLRLWATTIFARYREHPWAIDATAGARPTGPHEMAWLENALAALAGTGLTGAERLDAVALLNGHVRSLVQVTPAGQHDLESELARQVGGALAAHPDRYPQVLAAFSESPRPAERNNALDFGIDRILDGLAALIATRPAR